MLLIMCRDVNVLINGRSGDSRVRSIDVIFTRPPIVARPRDVGGNSSATSPPVVQFSTFRLL